MHRTGVVKIVILRACLAALAMGVFAGCTFQAAVEPPAAPAVAPRDRLPIVIGIHYPPDFLSYTHRQSAGAGPHSLTFPVGESSAIHISRLLNAYFERALRFSERPSNIRPAAGVDGVLIPQIEQLDMSDPALFGWGGSWITELVYRFQLLDPVGEPIASWLVRGYGRAGGVDWTGLAGSNIAGESFNAALEDAGRNFIQGFSAEPEIRRWLISRGIQTSRYPHRGHPRIAAFAAARVDRRRP